MYKVKESIIRVNTHAFNKYLDRFHESIQEEKIKEFIDEIDTRPEVLAVYSTYETFILLDRAKDMLDRLVENMDFEKDPKKCKKNYFEFKVTTLYLFGYDCFGDLSEVRQIGEANELVGFSLDLKGV